MPTATASGALTGLAFIDTNHNGVFDQGEVALTGLKVTLTGTTTAQNTPVSTTAVTDGNGAFTFQNVLPGTYAISATDPVLLNGGVSTVSGLFVAAGQTVNQDLAFEGLDPHYVGLGLLSASTTPADYPCNAPAGGGSGAANYRPNNAPVVANAVANFSVAENSSPSQIDLAGVFSDPDITNSEVTFNTSAGPINVTLFDTTAPQTVANFFDYINAGDYNNTFFSRLIAGQYLQGGGAGLQTDPTTGAVTGLTQTPTNPTVPNEFSASNVQDTLAMALQSAANGNSLPNSATNEFFFNLGNNSANLDPQKFTVFGQINPGDTASQAVLSELASTSVQNEGGTPGAAQVPNVDLTTLPLNNYSPTTGTFATNATASNFLTINGVTIDSRDEYLTYSVVANSNPGLVTPTLTDEHLALNYAAGATGSSTITVQAADRYGATVDDTFTVNVLPLTITSVTNPISAANQTNTSTMGTTGVGDTVSVTASDGTNPSVTMAATVDGSGNWTATGIDVSGLANGKITYTATTTDANGNTASTTLATTKDAATQLSFTSTPITATAGTNSSLITVEALDSNGNPVANAQVNLSSNSMTGTFFDSTGTNTITDVVTGANGTASFVYNDTTAGTPTLTATDSVNPTATQTQQETVTAAAAAQVAFTSAPQTISAGTNSGLITVQIEDQYGNAVAQSDTINLSSTSATGAFLDSMGNPIVSVPASVVANGSGAASFLYNDTTGSGNMPTLTAADATNSLLAGTQPVTIN